MDDKFLHRHRGRHHNRSDNEVDHLCLDKERHIQHIVIQSGLLVVSARYGLIDQAAGL